ncbi:hypothetical protein WA158_004170 [Blastocystis sp. Blastoise]
MSKFKKAVGNFTPCCGGSCLISTAEGGYVYITLCGIAIPVIIFAICEGYNLYAFIFALIAWLTEPGIIPHGSDDKSTEDNLLTTSEKTLSAIMMNIRNGRNNNFMKTVETYPDLINHPNKEGRCLLHIAAQYGTLEQVTLLVTHGAHVSDCDTYGLKPIHYAIFEHRDEIGRYLYNYENNHGNTDVVLSEDAFQSISQKYILEVYDHLGGDIAEDSSYSYLQDIKSSTRMRSFIINNHIESLRYCSLCNVYMPPRSHHCRLCNTCILKFDHHCPWMSTCIGLRNKQSFLYMLIFGSLSLIMDVVSCIYLLYIYFSTKDITGDSSAVTSGLTQHIYLIIFLLFALLFIYPVIRLTIYNISMSILNLTTHEYITTKLIGESPYSKGRWANLCHELCSKIPPSLVRTKAVVV